MIVVNDELKKMPQALGSKPESFKTQGNECPTTLINSFSIILLEMINIVWRNPLDNTLTPA